MTVRYSDELADEICERLARGESLNAICMDDHMPSETAVRKWAINDVNGFSSKYAQARESQADHYADAIVTIADTAEDANIARLQIDARKWFASKVAPKRYGDKQEIDLNVKSDVVERLQRGRARAAKRD